ncbi:MAG: cyanophycin synthetase, partial [Pseudomonadota bacterium]
RRIFEGQNDQDTAVVGIDDLHSQSIAMSLGRGPATVHQVSAEFALGKGVSAVDGLLYDSIRGKAVRIADLREAAALPGRHNHQNAAAAYAACRALGMDPNAIMDGIMTYPGLPHRQESVTTVNGIRFINDSKATNPLAAEQAIKAWDSIYWIAGGKPNGEPLDCLLPFLDRVRKAYLIGEAAASYANQLDGKVALEQSGDLDKAIAAAIADAEAAGDAGVILLSPACQSFDQFKDFEARGEAFRQLAINHAQRAALMESA